MAESRGGMSENPFGGETRIDRINLLEFLESNVSAAKVMYSSIIQDAASNYLYAFLGRNGTSAEEFFYSWRYFFKITSNDKTSWDNNRNIKRKYTSKGQKITETHYLTDNEVVAMCFDKHYDFSGLAKHMSIDKFRSDLKAKRRKILESNWNQVKDYISGLYNKELEEIANGHQIPLLIWQDDLIDILVDPPTPAHLANVIYVSNKVKKSKRPRAKRHKLNKYVELLNRLQIPPSTSSENWGPLSQTERKINDN